MTDHDALGRLIALFFAWERPEIALFRRAVTQFRTDLPAILKGLRETIATAHRDIPTSAAQAVRFLTHAQGTVNPGLVEADVREMLIQHILTEEIFASVFDDTRYYRENNIARQLAALEDAFFTGAMRHDVMRIMRPYDTAIRANAVQTSGYAEKQTFLKVTHENFYKVYNPKAADRLGIVYTPNEIVRFMIDGADWLSETHFGKTLIEPGVEILDPATGTGTFIYELIETVRGQPNKLATKNKEELHANEVAILPYYVVNLNIEATYASVAGQYVEFPNLCFVDTLDNVGGLGIKAGHQGDLFGALSDENTARVQRQNKLPSVEHARIIAQCLRIEGGRDASMLTRQIEAMCDAVDVTAAQPFDVITDNCTPPTQLDGGLVVTADGGYHSSNIDLIGDRSEALTIAVGANTEVLQAAGLATPPRPAIPST